MGRAWESRFYRIEGTGISEEGTLEPVGPTWTFESVVARIGTFLFRGRDRVGRGNSAALLGSMSSSEQADLLFERQDASNLFGSRCS
jgi:hypothetical protein